MTRHADMSLMSALVAQHSGVPRERKQGVTLAVRYGRQIIGAGTVTRSYSQS